MDYKYRIEPIAVYGLNRLTARNSQKAEISLYNLNFMLQTSGSKDSREESLEL